MKSFIISILLALAVSTASAQYTENRVSAPPQEEVPFHIKKMQERAEAIRQAQERLKTEQINEEQSIVSQEVTAKDEIVESPKENIKPSEPEQIQHHVVQKMPDAVRTPEVIQQTQTEPVKTVAKYSDVEIQLMVFGGVLLTLFVGSLAFHTYSTYFVNLADFSLTTLGSIAAFLHFKDNSLEVFIGLVVVNLVVGFFINGNSIPKAIVSVIGRLSGMIVFFLAILASLFYMAISKANIMKDDDAEMIRHKKKVERDANITGVAIGGSVSYLVYKYFIDNTNVAKYSEGEE